MNFSDAQADPFLPRSDIGSMISVNVHSRETAFKEIMIVAALNQKGGVGKTTLSTNIAGALARRGYRVLLVDVDPQGSALNWAAARKRESLFTVAAFPRETVHNEMKSLGGGYDHIVIDGPARAERITRSAIMASDVVLVPVQPSPYDTWSSEDVVNLINEARVYRPDIKSAFVVNRKITNTVIGQSVGDGLATYPFPIFDSAVGQRVIFAESAAQGLTVFEVDANGPAADEIDALTTELMEFAK